jgi:hypothetical protein
MYDRPRDYLFATESLDAMLRRRTSDMAGHIDQISQEQFLVSSDEDLIAHLLPTFSIEPLELHEDQRSMQQSETSVDVSRDRSRVFMPDTRGPVYIPGTRIEIAVPFSGEAWLFAYKTNPSLSVFPRGVVDIRDGRRQVNLTFDRAHDVQPESIKRDVEDSLRILRQCVEFSAAQVRTFNTYVRQNLVSAISGRRARLQKHSSLADILDIPLAAKAGAPPLKPIMVETKRPPSLPNAPKSGLKPEPGISDDVYEKILGVIRHEGRTFETTPATFSKFVEEELRDLLVAHLNGHFQGKAAGEVFRKLGKTDICIQEENRSAFVGECKVWGGAAQVSGDIDQLLGYLTWRDSKAAMIVFNKSVKGFAATQEALINAIREHPHFVKELGSNEPGEWRVVMRSQEDEGRRVTVHVFAFNIYVHAKK